MCTSTTRIHYVGIDPSLTKTGVAIITQNIGNTIEKRTYTLKPAKNQSCEARLLNLKILLVTTLIENCPETVHRVCMEEASYQSIGRQVDLAELRGVFKVALLEMGTIFQGIAPNRLKKFGAGHGDASKDKMVATAIAGGWDVKNDDEADAAHLAHLSYAMDNHHQTRLSRAQLEVLKDLGITL